MGRNSLNQRARLKQAETVTQARADAIEQMPSKLVQILRTIEHKLQSLRAETLDYYYSIGKQVQKVRAKPEDYVGSSGTPGIALLQQALGTQARVLRKAADFVASYTEEQLEELKTLKNPDTGYQLHWGHVSYLLSVQDHAVRSSLAVDAVEQMLDPPTLHAVIKKRLQRSGGHGRSHKMPESLTTQVSQILRHSRAWLEKAKKIWNGDKNSVVANLLQAKTDDVSNDILVDIDDILVIMAEMEEQVPQIKAALARAKERVTEQVHDRTRERMSRGRRVLAIAGASEE